MVKESDIFGGKQWTKKEQFADEMEALKYQMKYTIQSHRRLKKGEWKQIQDFIETFFGSEYMSDADEPIPLLKGYEHAFIGIGRQQYGEPIAIYDGEKCKESHEGIMRLVKESMDDALDRYEGTFKTNNETMQYDNLNEAFVGMGYMPNVQPLVIYDSDKLLCYHNIKHTYSIQHPH